MSHSAGGPHPPDDNPAQQPPTAPFTPAYPPPPAGPFTPAGPPAPVPAPAGGFVPGSYPVTGPAGPAYPPAAAGPAYRLAPGGPAYPVAPTAPISGLPGQYAGPQVSGVPGSVPPAFGIPMDPGGYGAAAPQPAPRGRTGMIVLSILTVLFVLAAGAMTGLYISKNGELDRTRKDMNSQVADRDTQLTSRNTEIEQLKKDWQSTKDKLSQTEQSLTGTQNSRDQVEKEKLAIAKCLDLLTKALTKAAGGTSITKAEGDAIDAACDEADKYLP